ncbi:MAG: 2-phospho-L-lactate guanylyltransferase [Halieaceae bacterium]|jgi:2-phospho-L-lactate guanylyltransferase|nr:2-phospho-L-lactate guanylyltransferase [Halieaceae bacterium]
MTHALLPLKDLVRAKTRLAGILAPFERRALAQAMVEDVLAVLSSHSALEGTLLVSDDAGADLLARKYKVELLVESALPVTGLNQVLNAGCERLAMRGVEDVVIVHSDLPLLSSAAVSTLLSRYHARDKTVVISPDRLLQGTNVLVTSTRDHPEFRYGPDSCSYHRLAARERGYSVDIVLLPATGLDVDTPADLLDLSMASGVGVHTGRFLAQDSIRRRLAVMIEAAQSALHAANGGEA